MPVIKSAKKKLRKDKKRTLINNQWRARLDALLKKAKKQHTVKTIQDAISHVDKSAKKHLLHKNKASRIKASLTKLVPTTTSAPKKPLKKKSK